MTRLKAALPVLVAVAVTWGLTTATNAQTDIPAWSFVRDGQGQIWLVGTTARLAVPIYPATDDQINAIGWNGKWVVPKPDGLGVQAGAKPEWATDPLLADGQLAPAPVANDPTAVPAPAPTNTPRPAAPTATAAPSSEDPVKLSGERAQNTKPFTLRGGNYTARWEAKLIGSSTSCIAYAYLYRVDPKRLIDDVMSGVMLSREGNKSDSGETQLYGVTAGQYYLDVNTSACSWTITITPQ